MSLSASSSDGETHAAVLRDGCISFEEAVASRLSELYERCEALSGLHAEVASAAVSLTAGMMMTLADLGESDQGDEAITKFNVAVQEHVFNAYAGKIVSYNPQVESASVFGRMDNAGWLKVRTAVIEKMGEADLRPAEEEKLASLQRELKQLEQQYQQKVEDLVSLAKFGQVTRNDPNQVSSTTEEQLKAAKERLRIIFQEKHNTEDADARKKRDSILILGSEGHTHDHTDGGIKRIFSSTDSGDDSPMFKRNWCFAMCKKRR